MPLNVPTRALVPALIVLGLTIAGCGGGREVEVAHARREAIEESFTEPARTRLKEEYVLRMPVDGRIDRIPWHPGDRIEAGQEIVPIDRVGFEQELAEAEAAVRELEAEIKVKENDQLEQTAMIETRVVIEAFAEALKAADAEIEAHEARARRATTELERTQSLARDKAVPQNQLDDRRLEAETSTIELRRQQFYRAALNTLFIAVKLGPRYVEEFLVRKDLEKVAIDHRLSQARARLARARHQLERAHVRTPVSGIVLERLEAGDGTFPVSHPLLRVGRMADLEIVTEVLSQDALRLTTGTPVRVHTGAAPPVDAVVGRVEPYGFTKRSSLGVEQQRVNVVVRLDAATRATLPGLGVGYRVRTEFVTDRKKDALVVDRYSVLQGEDGGYAVLEVVGGVIRRRPVRLGIQNDRTLEILEGLDANPVVVAIPDATMQDGDPVRPRPR